MQLKTKQNEYKKRKKGDSDSLLIKKKKKKLGYVTIRERPSLQTANAQREPN